MMTLHLSHSLLPSDPPKTRGYTPRVVAVGEVVADVHGLRFERYTQPTVDPGPLSSPGPDFGFKPRAQPIDLPSFIVTDDSSDHEDCHGVLCVAQRPVWGLVVQMLSVAGVIFLFFTKFKRAR